MADAPNIIHEKLYEKELADEIFELLKTIQMNTDEESQVEMYGRWINIPRKQTAMGDPGTTYSFSGNKVEAKPWAPFLLAVRECVANYLVDHVDIFADGTINPRPNFVLINLYENGKHYIGPHSDDERDLQKMGPNKEVVIVSLSFGATRTFRFENIGLASKRKVPTKTIDIDLTHGDICIMRGQTQAYWKHSVPKDAKCKKPRFNLTFRFMS